MRVGELWVTIRARLFRPRFERTVQAGEVTWQLGADERWRVARAAADSEVCRECGCTTEHACEGGCWWVAAGLCNRCVPSYGGTD